MERGLYRTPKGLVRTFIPPSPKWFAIHSLKQDPKLITGSPKCRAGGVAPKATGVERGIIELSDGA